MTLPKRPAGPFLAFALTAVVALVYALYTQHAWEDYYITYRASKNLATGHGLVFNVGDRLHTFTSPLGVLLPAVASLLTANTSDPAALWIFRVMCITALGGAAALLVLTARRLRFGAPAVCFIVAGLALDAKIVDFTINGMETAFMMLFLAYALWAHLTPGPRQWLHLGGAWAGLMWTRPDSFVYVGLLAAGFWLFPDPAPDGLTRKKMLGLFLRAGAVTVALYLPWLLFTQFYYGAAVPHTITAKSGIGDPRTLAGLLRTAVQLPLQGVAGLARGENIVDFTLTGMETAFMVLLLAYAVWAHLSPGPRQWRHLGAAWAGLMWTRPDSLVYAGLIAAGFWLFPDPEPGGPTARQTLGLFLRAGAVAAALYLPWLVFACFYYGPAMPHPLTGLLRSAVQVFLQGWTDTGSLRATFLPAYYQIGGWPAELAPLSGALGILCALLWPLPFVRRETRVCSLAFLGAHAYLSYFPYFPFPWYIPSTTLLGVLTLGGLFNQILPAADASPAGRWRRLVPISLAVLLLAGSGWITWQTARQFRAQQQYIEEGNRRKIGEWLRASARPGDTVFLEPLGYIGFYSGLKTYDFPGMSSREMVRARGLVGNDWLELIKSLQPTWLVLRLSEATALHARQPNLLEDFYHLAKVFNVMDEVETLDVRGRLYLEHDARFAVYHLERPIMRETKAGETKSKFDVSARNIEGVAMTLVHAPGTMTLAVPPPARVFSILYGFPPDAYSGPQPWTDGAIFQIEWEADGQVLTLLNVRIDPVNNPDHRRLQRVTINLPPTRDPEAHLVLRTMSGGTTIKDWTCWGPPEFDKLQ